MEKAAPYAHAAMDKASELAHSAMDKAAPMAQAAADKVMMSGPLRGWTRPGRYADRAAGRQSQ